MSDPHDKQRRTGASTRPARTHEAPGIVSPETVYGTVIVAAIIFAVSADEDPWDIVFATIGSVLVLWAVHVYAEAVSAHGRYGTSEIGIKAAIGLGVRQSSGILFSAIVPVILLFLGAIGLLSKGLAVDLSLWSSVIVLAVLGYLAFRGRGSSVFIRLIGAVATAAFGVGIIVLKAFIH